VALASSKSPAVAEQPSMTAPDLNLAHCVPDIPTVSGFNQNAVIPFGVDVCHIQNAMIEFTEFLGFIDTQLATKGMERFEDMLMPANFSSMVGEFMTASIPKYCTAVAKNTYHNGHPDILPVGKYAKNSAKHAGADGIEVKASRYLKGWQGHNEEDVWLMVFVFDGGRPSDKGKGIKPAPFRFLLVCGALLEKRDWLFAGRSKTSRRTITASVTRSGFEKMIANWIYRAPELEKGKIDLVSVANKK
jgi:hypothetical protein